MRKYIGTLGVFLGVIIFSGYSSNVQAASDFFDEGEFDFEFELYESDIQNERWNDINGRNSLNSSSSGQTNAQDQNIFSAGTDAPSSVQESGQLNPTGGMLNGLQGSQDDLSGLMLEGVSSGLGIDSLMSQLNPLSGLGLGELQQNPGTMNEDVNEVDENDETEEYKYYKASDVEGLMGVMSVQLPEPFSSPVSIEELLSGYLDEAVDNTESEIDLAMEDNFEKTLEEELALTPFEWRVDFTGILMSYEDILEAGDGEDPWNGVIREEGLIDFWAFIRMSNKLGTYNETEKVLSTLRSHYGEYQDDVEERIAELEEKDVAGGISAD
ncbi:hypothetical protein [Salipaludibacillus sp. CF4.18]|uniref:hypothetical protein n=1 Tax=Salipaludibacillus sp. CF4.18 TaxID=3373081 RepID=UPI003EE64BD2